MISIPIHPKHHKTHTYRITHVHAQTHTNTLAGSWVHTHILTGSWVNKYSHSSWAYTHTNILTGSQVFSQDRGCTHTHIHPSGLWLVTNLAFYAESTSTVISGQTQDRGCTPTHADCEKGHTCMSKTGHTYC